MEEEKVIEISMKKDGSTILVEFEPKNALKVEEEDRTLYLVKGNNTGEKEECYYLFDERKNSKIKNINIDKYSEEEMQSLLDFFKNKKAVNVEIDDLPKYVRTYDVECPVKDVLNGNYAGFTRTPAGSTKSISIKILEVNDKNEPTKIEVTMDGITNTITDIEYCKRAIKKYAAQEKKEYDDVLKELIENMNHKDEKKDNKKKKICVTALAIGSGIALLITGAIHIDRAIQKGHVVTNNKNKVVTNFQVSDKSTGSESISVKDDTIVVEEKVEEIKSDEVQNNDIIFAKSGDYQTNMFEIESWVNGKKNNLVEKPYTPFNVSYNTNIDREVLNGFNQMRSNIVFDAYVCNDKKQTKKDIKLFRRNFINFVYGGEDYFENGVSLYANMSIDAKRELMDIGLAVFSMDIPQDYYVDAETLNNDAAYEKINQTNDALYSDEYGTRSK